PPNVWLDPPHESVTPPATTKLPLTFQPTVREIPPVLFRLTSLRVGDVPPGKPGATVPLKFDVPVLVYPELSAMLCALVPEKVTDPPDVNVPAFEKSPESVVALLPAAYVPVIDVVPATVMSLEPV